MEIGEIKMEIMKVRELVDKFSKLPKIIKLPTYLELCRYPSSRFEEICSRLLSFFIKPTNEHGFDDLLLSSLLLTIEPEHQFTYDWNNLKVYNEVGTINNKRLDILIDSEEFVIGIENKIKAYLYNPLDEYRKVIVNNKNKKPYCVVLSLRKITDKDERQWLQQNEFINITYKDLFNKVKHRIGGYLNNCNDRYLTFLKDFINTIENMENSFVLNQPLDDYFADNADHLEVLTSLFQKYNDGVLSQQCRKISEIKDTIAEITNNPNWNIWENWDLYNWQWNIDGNRIGIEGSFDRVGRNPLGEFSIQITTWGEKIDFSYFQTKIANNDLLKDYKHLYYPSVKGERPYIQYAVLTNEEEIIPTLKKVYDLMSKIFNL